jgi:hypothetical protein
MKAKITVESNGSVTLEHDDLYGNGERQSTNYFVPSNGGYVRVHCANGNHYQVCDKLSNRGNTLSSTRENLPALIRAEWRKCKRDAYPE